MPCSNKECISGAEIVTQSDGLPIIAIRKGGQKLRLHPLDTQHMEAKLPLSRFCPDRHCNCDAFCRLEEMSSSQQFIYTRFGCIYRDERGCFQASNNFMRYFKRFEVIDGQLYAIYRGFLGLEQKTRCYKLNIN